MQKNYAFGEFVVRPAQRLLTRGSGAPVEIQAKAFDALVCLVQHPGQVVSRAEFSRTLWPKVVVEDNNLSQTIRALRLALGDAGPRYRFIATVPRRGYQFIAAVVERPEGIPLADAAVRPVRPRVPGVLLYLAGAALVALVSTVTLWRQASEKDVPASDSGRPIADTVVEGQVPSWPLPEVIACLPESARIMDPERCASAIRSVQEAERRRRQGLNQS